MKIKELYLDTTYVMPFLFLDIDVKGFSRNIYKEILKSLHEHDKEKWLVFGNLEIRITHRVERDFRTLRGTLTSKKSAVDIIRKMRENI